jgi:hypothetical protein
MQLLNANNPIAKCQDLTEYPTRRLDQLTGSFRPKQRARQMEAASRGGRVATPRVGAHAGLLRSSLVLLALMTTFACTSHHRVSAVPKQLLGKKVTVHLRDGSTTQAYAKPTATGVVWRPAHGGRDIAHESVASAVQLNHAVGFIQGLGLGILTGAATGIVMGLASGDDPPCDDDFCIFEFTAGDKALLLGMIFGTGGGILGPIIGGIRGSRDHYDFTRTGSLQLSAYPIPGGGGATSLSWSF